MFRTLVSTEQLAAHLGDRSWAVIDCRYDLSNDRWGSEGYEQAHIPGGVYASLSHDLAGARNERSGRHPLPSDDAMRATFGGWGIGSGTQVVCYDQDSGMYAARLWWMLRYMGHDAVAVLDGGLAKWKREARPTRAGQEHRPAVAFEGSPRRQMLQSVADVEHEQGDSSRALVDARAPERFAGSTEPLDRVAGHIPGARNHFFKNNLSDAGTMLAPDVLRERWQSVLGTTLVEHATMYCGSGVTACHNLLALEHAGLSGAKLYPGSWSEWSSDPARPIEKGSGS